MYKPSDFPTQWPHARRCWSCIWRSIQSGNGQPGELLAGERCGNPECEHVNAPTPDGLRPDLNIYTPWCGGVSPQFKVYWTGQTREEVLDDARGAGATSCWVVETRRFDDLDAWEGVSLSDSPDESDEPWEGEGGVGRAVPASLRAYPQLTDMNAAKISLQVDRVRVPDVPPGTTVWIGDFHDIEWFEGPAVWDGESWRFYPSDRTDGEPDGRRLWTQSSRDLWVADWSWTPYSWQKEWAAEAPDAWAELVDHALDPGGGPLVATGVADSPVGRIPWGARLRVDAGWPACGSDDWRYLESPGPGRFDCQHPRCVAARKADFGGLFAC